MKAWSLIAAAVWLSALHANADQSDPRVREVQYEADRVISVPVKKGVVTHIALDADEAITDVASGLGADCAKPEATWCIAAQAGGRNIFVKAKSGASTPNNLAVVTDRRAYSFLFVVMGDRETPAPVYRLVVHPSAIRTATAVPFIRPAAEAPAAQAPAPPSSAIRRTPSRRAKPRRTSCPP